VRPDKNRHVQIMISGKQQRKDGGIEERKKWKKERSKERKIKDRLSNGRCNFFRQHSPVTPAQSLRREFLFQNTQSSVPNL